MQTLSLTATGWPIETDSMVWPVSALGLGDTPRERDGKLTPDGRKTYTTGAMIRVQSKNGEVRLDRASSLNVIEPAANYLAGVEYQSDGLVLVQPYQNDSKKLVYSITVERLLPVDDLVKEVK